MNDDLSDEERSAQVRSALFKALGVVVVIGVLIFLGTTIMVRALGLNDDSARRARSGPRPTQPNQAAADDGVARPGDEDASPATSRASPSRPTAGSRAGSSSRSHRCWHARWNG